MAAENVSENSSFIKIRLWLETCEAKQLRSAIHSQVHFFRFQHFCDSARTKIAHFLQRNFLGTFCEHMKSWTLETLIFHADVGFRVGFLLEKRKFFYASCGVWCGCCVGESPFRFLLSRAHSLAFLDKAWYGHSFEMNKITIES